LAHTRAAAAAAAGHARGPSHSLYSRRRRRTMRAAAGPDSPGDFVIHDFVNEKTRSHILRAERQREDGGVRARYGYYAKVYFVLVALGVGAGTIAAVLDLVVEWLTDLKFGTCRGAWYVSRSVCCHSAADSDDCADFVLWADRFREVPVLGWLPKGVLTFGVFLTTAVLFVVISSYLVKRYAPYAAGSGVPEIKTVLSGVELKGYLSLWAMVVKIIGLGFSVSSGLNLGKEGPFVHLASALASVLASMFHELRTDFNIMLELITSGTAAGVAVAFNAPVGGVLFAFEEASSYFPNHVLWRSFLAATIAALTLKIMNPFFNGRAVMFEVDHSLEWYWFEIMPFFVIGALGGLVGVVFIKYNSMWTKFRLRDPFMRRSPILEAVGLVVLTTLMSYFVDFLKLSNNEILTTLFSECANLTGKEHHRASMLCDADNGLNWNMYSVLLYGTISKLFLTILTFGVRLPAGLFIPSMTIGACAGRIVGELTRLMYKLYPTMFVFHECRSSSICVRPSMYALVGASSALAGVTQVSVSLVVIMFELTGGLAHLLPTMIGILSAKMVCSALGYDEGIYDAHINLKRYPYLGATGHVSHTVPADTIMREPTVVLPQMGCTIGDLQRILRQTNFYGFPIVRSEADMILTGSIVRAELHRAIREAYANDPRVDISARVVFNGRLDADEAKELAKIDRTGTLVLHFANYRDRYLSQVAPETPVSDVKDCFTELGVRMCYVTRHGKLLGLVSKKDLIAYNDVAEHLDSRFFL
jgi:chloride channel 3/4/5